MISPIYLEERQVQELALIRGADPFSVAFIRGDLTMFAMVDTSEKAREVVTVRTRISGGPADDLLEGQFIGTAVEGPGGKVLHVWVDTERRAD